MPVVHNMLRLCMAYALLVLSCLRPISSNFVALDLACPLSIERNVHVHQQRDVAGVRDSTGSKNGREVYSYRRGDACTPIQRLQNTSIDFGRSIPRDAVTPSNQPIPLQRPSSWSLDAIAPVPTPTSSPVVSPSAQPSKTASIPTPASRTRVRDDFDRLADCESNGISDINTGNGYYGLYQFDKTTWHALGYTGIPSDWPALAQKEAAKKLHSMRGWQPWPACSRKLGLR